MGRFNYANAGRFQEDNDQHALFDWLRMQAFEGGKLSDVCFAIPNGGNRKEREAARMKKQGVKAGVLDVLLAVARGGYHGLFIEMKTGDNQLTDEQKIFKSHMERQGYMCVVCYSTEDAIDEIRIYIQNTGVIPSAGIRTLKETPKFYAYCRRMSRTFRYRTAAVKWLEKRGFNEQGERI